MEYIHNVECFVFQYHVIVRQAKNDFSRALQTGGVLWTKVDQFNQLTLRKKNVV